MIRPGWEDVIVAATGPSLTPEICAKVLREQQAGVKVIAVNDAWRPLSTAEVLYACDIEWWAYYRHDVLLDYFGERWTSNAANLSVQDQKTGHPLIEQLKLHLVTADHGEGFCLTPGRIHYGNNSGFQAVNLALQFGAKRVRLVGFNMQKAGGKSHFFGEHPREIDRLADYTAFIGDFNRAAALLPPGVAVVNCTRDSALTCFPMGEL